MMQSDIYHAAVGHGIEVGIVIGLIAGFLYTTLRIRRTVGSCADAAISDPPPKWWVLALAKAKHRKELKEMEQ